MSSKKINCLNLFGDNLLCNKGKKSYLNYRLHYLKNISILLAVS